MVSASDLTGGKPFSVAFVLSVALALLLAGHWFVQQRSIGAPASYLEVRGDSVAYVQMIEGQWRTMRLPFRYRVFVPLLARALPLAPLDSLRIISYASLFFCYVLFLLTCRELGLCWQASLVGVWAVFTSSWHLYHYNNPFIIDGFVLLTLSGLIYALARKSFWLFLAFTVLGVLSKETVIFLVPVWALVRDWRRGLIVLAAALAAFFLPRYLMSGEATPAAQAFLLAAQKNLMVRGPFAYVIALVTAWGFLWPLLGLGAALWPRDAARQFCVTAALLLAGGFFSSLIAADVARMFTPLSVLVACACAQLAATLWERGAGGWVYGLIGLSFLQAVFSITPRVFFSGHPGVFNNNGLRFVVLSVGLLFVAGMAWRLREALATAGRDNLVHLWNSRAVWFRSP